MEEVRTICTPFLVAAMFFCLYGILYIKRWQRRNPWYNQNDDEMRLSPQERMYRQNERRKYNNVPFVVFGAVFTCLLPMMIMLQVAANGDWNLGNRWLYLIPFIGILLLTASGIMRK